MEELKMVMDTLAKLGDGATTAFIWWLVCDYILRFIVVGFVVGSIIFVVYKLLNKTIDWCKESNDKVNFLEEICTHCNLSFYSFGIGEKKRIIELIDTGIKEGKK